MQRLQIDDWGQKKKHTKEMTKETKKKNSQKVKKKKENRMVRTAILRMVVATHGSYGYRGPVPMPRELIVKICRMADYDDEFIAVTFLCYHSEHYTDAKRAYWYYIVRRKKVKDARAKKKDKDQALPTTHSNLPKRSVKGVRRTQNVRRQQTHNLDRQDNQF